MSGQTDVAITQGSGTNIDGSATTGTGNIRQTITIGDPLTDANVAQVTSGKALQVDASATTQPVSGTVTANAGTNMSTASLALETGGNLAAIKADTDKIPAQGQALATASTPVVLTAIQAAALTPPTNTGYALDASLSTIDTDLKSNVTLHAGTNIIGKVTTDQTTHGTTDLVAADITKVNGHSVSETDTGVQGVGISQGGNTTAVKAASTAATATDKAMVVSLSPNSPALIGDGTNTANVVAGDTGFNGVATANATKVIPFTTSATGVQTLLANTDLHGWGGLTVVITSVGAGLALQGVFSPNTGGTYINVSTYESPISSGPGNLGVTANVPYSTPVVLPFFQIAISAMTSGTTSGYVVLTANARQYRDPFVGQSGTWTIGSNSATGSAVPAQAFYMAMNNGGNLAGLTTSNGDAAAGSGLLNQLGFLYNGTNYDRARSGGVTGMQGVSIQASPSGAFTYAHISTATTTVVKSGSGTLHNVSVNTLGTVASSCTIYDNTAGSGAVIGVINTLNLSGSFILDVAFTTGLTIVTTGTVAPDITVSYK